MYINLATEFSSPCINFHILHVQYDMTDGAMLLNVVLGSMFGTPASTGSSLFGQKPAQTTGSIFNPSATGGIFGGTSTGTVVVHRPSLSCVILC